MAQIEYEKIQIVVENAMRTVGGMSGTEVMENAWKDEYTVNGTLIKSPNNLQNLRDSTARAIVDALNATLVTGVISEGNTPAPNAQVVVQSDNVNINTAVSSPAARVGDDTDTTDTSLIVWMTTVSTLLNSISGPTFSPGIRVGGVVIPTVIGTIPIPPDVVGKITSGSSTVNIGD